MGSLWPLLTGMLALLVSFSSFSQSETSEFIYRGQETETLTLERILVETRTRTEMQDSTCNRQVPYEQRECGNETRYREECTWIPSREDCGRRDERRCRPVTRTRQECTTGPSRQVCRDYPGGQVCTNGPSREICENREGRQVCHDTPRGRVCRREAGNRVCRTVPGERTCRPAPPQRRCETIPGERVCRNVSYQDQECTTHSVPYCNTIPGRQDCRNIPYQEHVCRNVTRYRSESYACQVPVEIPYDVQVPVAAELNVSFANEFSVEVPFTALLTTGKTLDLKAKLPANMLMGLKTSPADVVQEGESFFVTQNMEVNLLSVDNIQNQLAQDLTQGVIDFKNNTLSINIKGQVEASDFVEVTIEGRTPRRLRSTLYGKVETNGQLSSLNAVIREISDTQSALQLDLSQLDLGSISTKQNHKIILKHFKVLPSDFAWSGEIPELSSQKEASLQAIR